MHSCLKNNIKIYTEIAPTCFGVVTPSSGSALFVLAEVTLFKIVDYGTLNILTTSASTNNALPEDDVTTPKHVGAISM
jgi:hypothetical protein